jgi:hypothetical protein
MTIQMETHPSKSGKHTLAIYSNSQEKLDAAFEFLKDGLSNDEVILLITDDLTKTEAIDIMTKKFENKFDVLRLVEERIINIYSSAEWYFSNGYFNINRINGKLKETVGGIVSRESDRLDGRITALRLFRDVKPLFENGVMEDLISYEESLEREFSIALNAICAYESKDLDKLNKRQMKALLKHHDLVSNKNYNYLTNPFLNCHIILLYEDQQELDTAIADYINEGLKRGQLCVHASVQLNGPNYIQNFSSKINNYERNLREGNLLLVNLADFYVNAMTENLDAFNNLRAEITEKAKNDEKRNDKHVRLTADCATTLLKNKHFDQCINLENWWHEKPFEGSYVCPYPNKLLKQYPYNYYMFKLFHNHDIVIDAGSNVNPKYTQSIVAVTLLDTNKHIEKS